MLVAIAAGNFPGMGVGSADVPVQKAEQFAFDHLDATSASKALMQKAGFPRNAGVERSAPIRLIGAVNFQKDTTMKLRTEHGQKQQPVRRLMDEAEIESGEEMEEELETQGQIEELSDSDQAPDQAPGETRERQQMIEGNADASRTLEQLEKQHALDRDNPDSRIDDLDPTPPKSD